MQIVATTDLTVDELVGLDAAPKDFRAYIASLEPAGDERVGPVLQRATLGGDRVALAAMYKLHKTPKGRRRRFTWYRGNGADLRPGMRVQDPDNDQRGRFGGWWMHPDFGPMAVLRDWDDGEEVYLDPTRTENRPLLDRLIPPEVFLIEEHPI